MNRDFFERVCKEERNEMINLSKFNIEGITISDCVVTYEGNRVKVKPCINKRKMKYVYQCQMCNRFFLGGIDKTGLYVGNCFARDFDKERDAFYNSELDIASVSKSGIKKYSVNKLLRIIHDENIKALGVWALWKDYGGKNEECIQVARNRNIYQEIMNNFENGRGSIDYSKYRENGTIVIVSDKCNSIEIEAQYAHDYKAKVWNPSVSESKLIGIAKGLRTS